ncbi:MAG TPA: LytTR family DNA-binding domain-containing protein [Candidatus Sulfotelmatobacter sp.]|nr:LytTR family DNA-binding domain-containing protein [Candidatus Sulfotelmatobacter sp.]
MSEPWRVLIVDDEPLARQAIRLLLAGDPEATVVGECAGADGAAEVERTRPDILFLDVQMPEVDGFELLDQIGIDRAPAVVFVTAHSDHALRAFDVHAIDYLLKPISDERFAHALARAKALAMLRRAGQPGSPQLGALLREHSRETRRILVRDRGRTHVIDVDAIDWIGAADYYAEIHAGGETHLLRETLNELAERLDPQRFFRVHRSAIIALDRVREIHALQHGDRELLLADGTRVRLSRARREEFERLLDPIRRAR